MKPFTCVPSAPADAIAEDGRPRAAPMIADGPRCAAMDLQPRAARRGHGRDGAAATLVAWAGRSAADGVADPAHGRGARSMTNPRDPEGLMPDAGAEGPAVNDEGALPFDGSALDGGLDRDALADRTDLDAHGGDPDARFPGEAEDPPMTTRDASGS
jgi:hypothetical protein